MWGNGEVASHCFSIVGLEVAARLCTQDGWRWPSMSLGEGFGVASVASVALGTRGSL